MTARLRSLVQHRLARVAFFTVRWRTSERGGPRTVTNTVRDATLVAKRMAQAVASSPTGIKGLMELALSLQGSLGRVLATALAQAVDEVVTSEPTRA